MWRFLCSILILSIALPVPTAAQKDPRPPNVGVETTRVSLILVDVDVLDEKGRPLPGLTSDDFSVQLDRRKWPIYSVDDLCRTDALIPAEADTPVPAEPGDRAAPSPEPPGPPADPLRFVMYFDFSHLQQDGRTRALREGRRWIQNTMRTGDEVMLVAYSTPSGLRTMTPFTSDKTWLLGAIQEAFDDLTLVDPFPSFRIKRMMECPPFCVPNAWDEYDHGRRSRLALQHFTEGLGLVPGRKVLLFFHQNGNLFPGRFYNVKVEDHKERTKMLGAAATEARTVIYSAFVGNSTDLDADEAVNLGYDLATYTGGQYSRGFANVAELTDEARVRSSCVYRIGLLPPEGRPRSYYPLRVWVRGRIVADELLVRFLSEKERWLKMARAVLVRPESASELPLVAGLVPVKADGKLWEMQVRIAVDMDSVTLLPSAEGRQGRWEVGALLIRDDGKETWEMLGNSEIQTKEDGVIGTAALHQKRFRLLRAGSYRLVAFVRDVGVNAFGGAEARIDLPDPRKGGLAGPILMSPGHRLLEVNLPLMSQDASRTSHASGATTGSIPLDMESIGTEEPLLISAWICGGKSSLSPRTIVRYLSNEGMPFARFDKAALQDAGDCYRIDDRVSPRRPVGRYAYHLHGPVDAEVSFEVIASAVP